jgi:nucleotide-binding universal stress UspA family protein
MKKILFPTDFSDAANHAFIYALKIAKSLQAEIVTLHVFQLPDVKALHLPNTLKEIYNSMDLEAFENYRDEIPFLRKLAEENGLGNIPISNILEIGEPIPVILKTAASIPAGMIVMGTKGAGWLKEIFTGSVTGEIMEKAACPVLAIPEKAAFDGAINKIAVTTDYSEEDCKTVEKVLEWASLFDATVDCLHVDASHTESITHRMDDFKRKFAGNDRLRFVVLNEFELEKSIAHYIEDNGIDILAMLTHRRSFFQELFNYSHAKAMTYHQKVPVLSIPAHTLDA